MNFDDFKNLVKDRTDIAAVIGKHAKLIRTPRGFKACCPLPGHKEKTPSFSIDKAKNLYYCYGCNRGGDAFKFLEVVEGLSFFEALKDLAAQANVEIPKNLFKQATPQSQAQKSRLELGYEVLDRVSKFYSRVLQSGKGSGPDRALRYLDERGISLDEINDLGLGWAPETGDALTSRVTEATEREVAFAAGVLRQNGTRSYDFFRNRLMIPIRDPRGRVIGFSGRTLDEVSSTNPKYINSSESDWFKKKSIVYGLDRASKFIREDGFVCVVEGYFDQWALHRREIPAVAVMGTALTEEHLIPLGRYSKKIVLVMDSDKAGIASTKKSLPMFFNPEWDVRVFQGFAGKDPDEWLRENSDKAQEVRTLLASAPEGFVWLAKTLLREGAEQKWNRSQVLTQAADLWRQAISESQKTALLDELEPVLGSNYDRQVIRRDFDAKKIQSARAAAQDNRGNSNQQSSQQGPYGQEPPPMGSVGQSRGSFSISQATPLHAGAGKQRGSTMDRAYREAIVLWLWSWDALTPTTADAWNTRNSLFSGTPAEPWVRFCADFFKENARNLTLDEVPRVLEKSGFEEELRNLLYKGLVKPEQEESREADKVLISFSELTRILEREKILTQISSLRNELRNYLADAEKTAQLLREVQGLSLSLEKLK